MRFFPQPLVRASGRALLGLLLAAAALTGCDGDSGGSSQPDAKQDEDTTDSEDDATSDDATDSEDDATTDDATSEPIDMCQNEADLGWLHAIVEDGKTGREVAREAAGDCGLACLNHPSPDQCAIKCMVESKGVELSPGCAGCYGGIVLCTVGECLVKCIEDPQAQKCKDCQEEKGCNTPFYACTGNLD